jgi:putative IMPACT (imprinted ancient) family translation regulator
MKQNNLVQCGLAVTRYFGGTKLGKRGLIDAYGTAARNVIDQTILIEWVRKERYLITCPIQYYGDLLQALLQTGGKILEDQSSNDLKWVVEIKTGMISDLIKIVRTVTKGEGDLDRV